MGRKKSQTVGYRYFVGVHFVLCHGPIDSIRAIYVDDKKAWDPVGTSAIGRPDGYETVRIKEPGLFGGEDREGGISGELDIGMGYRTQPKNGYLQQVLQGKLLPAYRGVVSVILRKMYVGTSPYLKPWKFRVQRIWAPTATGEAQWHPSVAGIGPPAETLPATEAGAAVIHNDKVYRIPASVVGPGNPWYGHARINKVTETDLITGEQETYDYGLTRPAGITNPSADLRSQAISRPQHDAVHVYTGPTGPEIFCGFYAASIVGGHYALILELATRSHRWVRIPDEWFAVPLYTPSNSASKLQYSAVCWVVRASDGRIYFKSMAGWIQNRLGSEDWQQDTVAFRVASFNPATGDLRREAWADGINVSAPRRGTGIIGAAMKPDHTSLVEHCQFMIAINNVISYYNGLMRYDFGTQQREMIGGPSKVQAWLLNTGQLAGNPILYELGRAAWGHDDNVYTMMPKRAGQLQSGMLGVWVKTSNPAGTTTVWELHWPEPSEYVVDDERFWYAPFTDSIYMNDWYSTPVSLADGRIVFPPANPFSSGAMVCPSLTGDATGRILTKWSGATLGRKPWPTTAPGWVWGSRLSGHYMVGVKTDDNDYLMVSGSYGQGPSDTYGGTWQGDALWVDPSSVRFLVSYEEGLYTRLITSLSDGPWDMNPAHIIRECMTNSEWGRGLPDSIIGPSYEAAAQVLYAEGLGLSMLWTSEMAVNDFILEVIRHIDAVRYEDPETGLQEIKLIRPDYDVATLPVLSPSNCRIEQLTSPTLYDLVNQITVEFWNRDTGEDSALAIQDTAAINMSGTVNNQTMQYAGICSERVALLVGQRDLARYSKPFRQGRLIVNRKVANIKPGDPFILNWPARGVTQMVCRAAKRSDNGELDGMIGIEFGEDIFSAPFNVANVPPPSGWEDPIKPPVNFDYVTMFDLPYPLLVEELGETEIAAVPATAGYAGFAGGRPLTGSHMNYGLFLYAAGATPPTDSQVELVNSFTPVAVLGEAIPEITDPVITVAVAPTTDMVNVRAGDWVIVGTAADPVREMMCVTEDPGDAPVALKLTRAVADTYPRAVPTGTPLFVVGTFFGTDQVERVDGEDVAGYGRPKNGKGSYEGPYTYLEAEMVARQGRPYPAAAFKVDGAFNPSLADEKSSVLLTWAHRHRVQQSNQPVSWLTVGNVGPETGVTYQVQQVALDEQQAEITDLPVLQVGAADRLDLDLIGQPYPDAARYARITVEAVRGGIVSLQNRPVTVKLAARLYAPTNLRADYIPRPRLVSPDHLRADYIPGGAPLLAPNSLRADYVSGHVALLAPDRLSAVFDSGKVELVAPDHLSAVYVGPGKLVAPDHLAAQYVGQAKLAAPDHLVARYVPATAPLYEPSGLRADYVGPGKLIAPAQLVARYVGPVKLAAPDHLVANYVPATLPIYEPSNLQAVYVGPGKLVAPDHLAAQYVGLVKLLAPTGLTAEFVPATLPIYEPSDLRAQYVGLAKLVAPSSLAAQYEGVHVLNRPDMLRADYLGIPKLAAPTGLKADYI
ncbi:hypothetical protein EX238_14100 [Providencia rettgeri]|nr:hypothetical protein [Providencia rettgeri]